MQRTIQTEEIAQEGRPHIMSRTYKKLQAGRYCVAVAYSRPTKRDNNRARAEKKNHSNRATKAVNDRNSRVKLTGIIAANFADSKTAYFVTPSFDSDHYPNFVKGSEYRAYCRNEARRYLNRLRRIAAKRNSIFKYAFSVGVGECGRWHFHALIDGVTQEDIQTIWEKGEVNVHRLYSDSQWITERDWYSKVSNVNPIAIAKYMIRNASSRQIGQHPWHVSKNCIRPKITEYGTIPDSIAINTPEGSEILDSESTQTVYSSFQFIEYILPREKNELNKRGSARKKQT